MFAWLKRLVLKAVIGALLGFTIVIVVGFWMQKFQPFGEWYPWLSGELSTHPQSILTAVGVVALIFLFLTRKKKDE